MILLKYSVISQGLQISQEKLTALRRAIQFKGVLKNQLIRFLDDTLKIVEEKVLN